MLPFCFGFYVHKIEDVSRVRLWSIALNYIIIRRMEWMVMCMIENNTVNDTYTPRVSFVIFYVSLSVDESISHRNVILDGR